MYVNRKHEVNGRNIAGEKVMELAGRRGLHSQAALIERIKDSEGIDIAHQKLSQWCKGDTSFPNNFAQILTRSLDLGGDEQIELALALSFGQKNRQLLRPDVP